MDGSIPSPTYNLSLKSDEEQKATIFQFQSFLNTLDFAIQISVQSRKLDIRPYLLLLENRIKIQTEPLLKLQTKEYIEFIRNFTDTVAIMTKNFFIVIPYTHTTFKPDSNIFSKIFLHDLTRLLFLMEVTKRIFYSIDIVFSHWVWIN